MTKKILLILATLIFMSNNCLSTDNEKPLFTLNAKQITSLGISLLGVLFIGSGLAMPFEKSLNTALGLSDMKYGPWDSVGSIGLGVGLVFFSYNMSTTQNVISVRITY
jgi:hypothetical protein